MEDADRPRYDGSADLSTVVKDLFLKEQLPTDASLSSAVPTILPRHASTMNNGGFVQCSSTFHHLPRQDTNTAHDHTAQACGPNTDTNPFQHTATSDVEPTSSTQPSYLLFTTTPNLSDIATGSEIVRIAKVNMGRFNKRAYRQGHQTREFFDYQQMEEQESSDGKSEPGTTAVSTARHPAAVQGIVQHCPGAENCPDCKAGRSAPVHNKGSSSVPADVRTGAPCPSAFMAGKPTGQMTGIRVSDMYHGLMPSEEDFMEATKRSKALIKTESEGLLDRWEVLGCLTARLRRKAAEVTILHLAQELDITEIDECSTAKNLPFLNEDQLAQMISSAKIRSEFVPDSRDLIEADSFQGSSPTPTAIVAALDKKFPQKGEDTNLPHIADSKKATDIVAAEGEGQTEKGRIWADLLTRENRRMKAKWLLQMEEGLKEGHDEGAAPTESAERKKKIYEAIRTEDRVRWQANRKAAVTTLEDDLDHMIRLVLQTAVPSHLNVRYSERYSELLANSNFQKIAKRSLNDWCVKSAVPARSKEAAGTYLRLLRSGEDYPKHAWDSALPPVWDAAGMHWIWQDFSKGSKGKDIPASYSGGDDGEEMGKDVASLQAGEGGGRGVTLTKNQKRAQARKEKRKAQRAVADIACNHAASLQIAGQQDKDVGEAARAATPQIPSRTEEEFQQAIQAASAGIEQALASRAGPSTSTETVTKDGVSCRVPAAARVSLARAIKLASTGRLSIATCPALGRGDADRLLRASHRFQSAIDAKKIGKDPYVITKFLTKVGIKPSEYEKVLELNKFLEVMKKVEVLNVDDSNNQADDVAAAGKGESKGKGKAKAATIHSVETAAAVSYPPPPPRPRHRTTVVPWAVSLTPAQIKSLSHTDRWIHLRGLLFNARSFLSSAARLLPERMFDRLVNPAAGVLTAPDLPLAQYRLGRTITFTRTMQDMYAKFEVEKAQNPPGTPVTDHAAEAAKDLNARYEKVEEMVAWARRQAHQEHVNLLRMGREEEGTVQPGTAPPELLALAERVVGGEEIGRLATEKAEAVAEFTAAWPQLEGLVTGEVGRYVPA